MPRRRRATGKTPRKKKTRSTLSSFSPTPLPCLPDGCWTYALGFLSAADLHGARRLDRRLRNLCATTDSFLWRQHCARLWEGKVDNAVRPFRDNVALSWRQKYILSLQDSRRTKITAAELCGWTWAFRFKEAVGHDFLALDEYWDILPPFRIGTTVMVRRFETGAEQLVVNPGRRDPLDRWADMIDLTIRWRITKSRNGRRGQFLKLNNWPSGGFERNMQNWGWLIHNEWTAYCSPPTLEHMRSLHDRFENTLPPGVSVQ